MSINHFTILRECEFLVFFFISLKQTLFVKALQFCARPSALSAYIIAMGSTVPGGFAIGWLHI